MKCLQIHNASVKFIIFNHAYNTCISIDKKGFIEIWDPNTYDLPKLSSGLQYSHKIDTDFYELLKKKTTPTGACLSPNGEYLAIYSSDK